MKKDDVPQDNSKSYQGQKKLLYAVDENGHYQGVASTGWDVEAQDNGKVSNLVAAVR